MRPSIALAEHHEQACELLLSFGMTNPRLFGSTARGDDGDHSDLDMLIDAVPGATLYDLARYDLARAEIALEALLGCKVELLTAGFLAPDVAQRAQADLVPIP
jgi:predicted nucleotidyltransferase